jgi:protein SCO1
LDWLGSVATGPCCSWATRFVQTFCPYTLANLEAVLDEMAKRIRLGQIPRVVFVAVDPGRDRPVLKAYLRNFGGRFTGVTGTLDAIQVLVDGGYVQRDVPDKDGNYRVVHTAAVNVVDPSARIVGSMLPPFEPTQTADRLIALVKSVAMSG